MSDANASPKTNRSQMGAGLNMHKVVQAANVPIDTAQVFLGTRLNLVMNRPPINAAKPTIAESEWGTICESGSHRPNKEIKTNSDVNATNT